MLAKVVSQNVAIIQQAPLLQSTVKAQLLQSIVESVHAVFVNIDWTKIAP